MKIFEGKELTRDIVKYGSVFIRPADAVEAVLVIETLRDKFGLQLRALDENRKVVRHFISCACREGILITNGEISIDGGDILYRDNLYAATVKQVVPDYQSPQERAFNAVAKRLDAIEERLDLIEQAIEQKPTPKAIKLNP